MWVELGAIAFSWSYRAFRFLQGGLRALFEGFWMGLLPERAWDLISERSYGAGKEYTNRRWLDSGLMFWEVLLVEQFFRSGARVLVAAAGGGREVIALAVRGFAADGFDCSSSMVAAGVAALAERGIAAKMLWAPPCEVPELNCEYGGVIVGWNGYTYIVPRERRIAFLRKLRALVPEGAPILISVAKRSPSRAVGWTACVANAVRICTGREPIFEDGTTFEWRPRMQFRRGALEQELQEAGFAPRAFYRWGDYCAVAGLAKRAAE